MNVRARYLGFAGVLTSILLGIALAGDSLIAVLMAVGVILTGFLLVRPQWAVIVILVAVFLLEGLSTHGIAPPQLSLASDYVLVIGMTVALMGARHRVGCRTPKLMWPVVVLIGVALASAVWNQTPFLGALLAARTYLKYSLVYFIIVLMPTSGRAQSRVLAALVLVAYLQIPVSIVQYVGGGAGNSDLITGTLGRGMTGVQTIWLLLMLAYIYETAFANPAPLKSVFVLLPLALLIPVVLNETKIALFFGPVVFLWVVVTSGLHKRVGRLLRLTALLVAGIAIMFSGYQALWGFDVSDSGAIEQYMLTRYHRGEAGGRLTRMYVVQEAIKYIGANPRMALFGYGPGAVSESSIAGVRGVIAEMNPGAGLHDTFFSRMTIELGLLGWTSIGLIIGSIVGLARASRRHARAEAKDPLPDVLVLVALSQVLLSVYTATWTAPPLAFTLWALAGLVEKRLEAPAVAGMGCAPERGDSLRTPRLSGPRDWTRVSEDPGGVLSPGA